MNGLFTDYGQEYAEFQGIHVDSVPTGSSLPLHMSRPPFYDPKESSGFRLDLPTAKKTDNVGSLPLLPVSSKDSSYLEQQQRWNWTGRLMDLERDGDWREDNNSVSRRSTMHRRSNSSVQFSELSPSRHSVVSNVASLHRRVRGHPPLIPYNRQDIEWEGIHNTPPGSYPTTQQRLLSNDSGRKWNDGDQSGWTLA